MVPGSDVRWGLPAQWRVEDFKLAWAAAEHQQEELRIEVSAGNGPPVILCLFPHRLGWYSLWP
jgi:hypothetical protein